jgi:hypothetical protein
MSDEVDEFNAQVAALLRQLSAQKDAAKALKRCLRVIPWATFRAEFRRFSFQERFGRELAGLRRISRTDFVSPALPGVKRGIVALTATLAQLRKTPKLTNAHPKGCAVPPDPGLRGVRSFEQAQIVAMIQRIGRALRRFRAAGLKGSIFATPRRLPKVPAPRKRRPRIGRRLPPVNVREMVANQRAALVAAKAALVTAQNAERLKVVRQDLTNLMEERNQKEKKLEDQRSARQKQIAALEHRLKMLKGRRPKARRDQ